MRSQATGFSDVLVPTRRWPEIEARSSSGARESAQDTGVVVSARSREVEIDARRFGSCVVEYC